MYVKFSFVISTAHMYNLRLQKDHWKLTHTTQILIVCTGPPSYPEKFHYTERTKDSLTLTWKPPRNDGGSPLIGYFVEKKRQDQQAFEPCNTEICPNLTMTVTGLEEDWMYEFRIKCANLIGESEPSIPLTVIIQDDEGEVASLIIVFWLK